MHIKIDENMQTISGVCVYLTAEPNATILKKLTIKGIKIRAECGGRGICGKCKVVVENPNRVSPLTNAEKNLLKQGDIAAGLRLACQAKILQNMYIIVPYETLLGSRRKIMLIGTPHREPQTKPSIKKFHIALSKPTLYDSKPDLERLIESIPQKIAKELDIDYEVLKTLPNTIRCANWDVTVTIRDNRIINVEKGDTSSRLYGFVVDLGTSKIVGHLVDLITGRTVGAGANENPQLTYGADIITRTKFAATGVGLKKLQKLLINGINSILGEICSKAGVDPNDIYEALVVGNPVILHILFSVQPKYLALSPFIPAFRQAPELPARELNIKINRGGMISTLPIVAGFVGGDVIADCLAIGIHKSDENTLLLDIGTNTEILLGNKKGIFCCSCAAGPAFENHVEYGLKAIEGSIEEVSIDQDYEVRYKTIGGSKPVGICGSALIQIIYEMFKHKIIDKKGTFNRSLKTPRITNDGFIIASRNETATGQEIKITQKDVDEIILAKAAIRTGCSILMRKLNLRDEEIERVFIAGDFGSALDLESSIGIGLLPNIPLQKIKKVGNVAVEGAKICLISRDIKKEISKLLSKIHYIELTLDPEFEEEFIKNLCIN